MSKKYRFKVPKVCREAVNVVYQSCVREFAIYGLGKSTLAVYNRLFMDHVYNTLEDMLECGPTCDTLVDGYYLLPQAYAAVDACMDYEDIGAAVSIDDPISKYMDSKVGMHTLDSKTVAEFLIEAIPDGDELALLFEPLYDEIIDMAHGCDIKSVSRIERSLNTVCLMLDTCE